MRSIGHLSDETNRNIEEKKENIGPGNAKDYCTIDLLFDWFGLVCFANKNKNYLLSYS